MSNKATVLVVDLQADFTQLHQGALAVEGTDASYVEQLTTAVRSMRSQDMPVVASKDFHPRNHISFYTSHPGHQAFEKIVWHGKTQVLWPPHCVQGTRGARIVLPEDIGYIEVAKGYRSDVESYSAFYDDDHGSTGLLDILQTLATTTLYLCGVATDYCVMATALHGRQAGLQIEVLINLCRGVDPEATKSAMAAMHKAGVIIREYH